MQIFVYYSAYVRRQMLFIDNMRFMKSVVAYSMLDSDWIIGIYFLRIFFLPQMNGDYFIYTSLTIKPNLKKILIPIHSYIYTPIYLIA